MDPPPGLSIVQLQVRRAKNWWQISVSLRLLDVPSTHELEFTFPAIGNNIHALVLLLRDVANCL